MGNPVLLLMHGQVFCIHSINFFKHLGFVVCFFKATVTLARGRQTSTARKQYVLKSYTEQNHSPITVCKRDLRLGRGEKQHLGCSEKALLRSCKCKTLQLLAQPEGRRFHVLLQLLPGSSHAAGNSFLQGFCNSHSSWSGSNTGRSLPPSAMTWASQGTEGPVPSHCQGADLQEQHSGPAIARSLAASEDLQPKQASLNLPPKALQWSWKKRTTHVVLVKRLSSSKGQTTAIPQACQDGDGGAEQRAPHAGSKAGGRADPR